MEHRLFKTMTAIALVVLMVVALLPTLMLGASAEDAYTGTGTFKQATGTLTSGYYVFGVGSDATSISAVSTATAKSNWIGYTTTASTSGIITNPDTSIVWYYDAEAGTFNNDTNYVAWPTPGNSAALNATGTPLTVTETETAGVYNITVTATSARNLRLNGTSGYRFYTSITGTNTFYFFKLAEAKHEHFYTWNKVTGTDGSHTLTCANTDGKCDALTTTEDCTWVSGYCSVCGAEAPDCAHPTTTEVAEVPATCTEIGYTAGVQCTVCNQYTSGHEEIAATGHTEEIDAAVAATCTTTGLTEGKHCNVCDEILVAQETIPALGHNYVDGTCTVCGADIPLTYILDYTTGTNSVAVPNVTKELISIDFGNGGNSNAPKWYTTGTAIRFYANNTVTITVLDDFKDSYYIKSITFTLASTSENNFTAESGTIDENGEWTPDNNKTNSVKFTNVTSDNKQVRISGITIELSRVCTHANTTVIGDAKDATCTEDGITAGEKCVDCGEILTAQETIDALGHIDEDNNGYCDRTDCNELMCTEHIWVGGEVTQAPTCTATGLQEQHCEKCGTPGENIVLDMVDHTSVTDEAVAPTCTETGLTEGSHCSVCGEVLVAQTDVPMIAHNHVDGVCTECGDVIVSGDQLADFEFDVGATYQDKHYDGGSIGEEKAYTVNNYTLTITGAANVYDGAFDAVGHAALKLGTGSKAATFSFTVDGNVKTVVIYIAAYKTNDAKISVNGTEYVISSSSDAGKYTKVVIDTTEVKTVSLVTLSGGYRAMIDSIEFWGEKSADAEIEDNVGGNTVTLGDNIGVNFYMNLTETTLADDTAYMTFTLANGETITVYVKDIKDNSDNLLEYEGKTLYKFSAFIAAKEMADEIKAQLITAAGNSGEFTYDVQSYALSIITGDYTDNEKALAKAMLNYGANAQLLFGYNTDNLVNSVLDEADRNITMITSDDIKDYKKVREGNITGVTFLGATTMWEADTTIRFYFDIEDENVTFTYNGIQLEVKTGAHGKYVAIDGIVAKDMATTYELVISNGVDTQTIGYSVYSYFYDFLASDNFGDTEKTAICAAYHYSQAAITYFGK